MKIDKSYAVQIIIQGCGVPKDWGSTLFKGGFIML